MAMQRSSFALLFLASLPAYAGLGPIPGEERFASSLPQGQQSMSMDFGAQKLDGDWFLAVTPRTELNLGPVGLGLQVPLNLRMYDADPKAQGDYFGRIRKEDWDEPAEFLKVIRYLRLGHKRDSFYLRVGEQTADLGHGTIVYRYMNNLDINTTRVGLSFDVNTDWGGVETIIGDLGTFYDSNSVNSRLVGTRLYVKPVAFYDPTSMFNIVSIGTSVVSDMNAPRTYELDGSTPVVKDGRLVVAKDTAATVYGFDLEIDLMHNALLDIVPYTDLNFIQQAGKGLHAGVQVTAKMPIGIELSIPVRLEYRRFDSDYMPQYFNVFYEVERYSFLGSDGVALPKAVGLRRLPDGKGLNGIFGDLAFDFAGIFQLGAVYEDYEGGNPNMQAFLSVPALETFQFKAFYARTNIAGTDDIFKLDDKSIAVVQARYELLTYVYLVGRATQRWVLKTSGPDEGTYKGDRTYQFGLEFALTF